MGFESCLNVRALVLGLSLVGWTSGVMQARAQEQVTIFAASPAAYLHGPVREPLVQAGPTADARVAHVAQRRARLMLAVGLGLTLSAGAHLAAVRPTRYCAGEREPNWSRNTAWPLGAAGLALAVAGGSWLVSSSLRAGFQRPSRAQRWIATAAGSVAAVGPQSVMLFLWGFAGACSS